MIKNTPGPWVYHSGMVWKDDGSEDGIPIARMDRETPQTVPVERDANARLIAAAPEMLKALRLCECELSTYRILAEQSNNPQAWEDAIRAARAAMVKATGK